jgi:hypothetical protein
MHSLIVTGAVGVAAVAVLAVLAFDRPAAIAPAASNAATAVVPPVASVPLDSAALGDTGVVEATAPSDVAEAGPRAIALAHLRDATKTAWIWNTAQYDSATAAALAALTLRESLDAHDTHLAEGIVALGRREFPIACDAFASARAVRESFASWMGTAECRTRDSLVVTDANGQPAFRSNLYEAALAYREAGRVAEGAERSLAYSRLPHVLFTDPARVRRGSMGDGRVMLGQAIARGDSIAFEAFGPGPRRRSPDGVASSARAVSMAREMLRPALVSWIAADPGQVRARELLVELLESTGNVRDAAPDGLTALTEVRAARALPADREATFRLARAQVRLLLRAGEFGDAARLADSALSWHSTVTNDEAEIVLSLAMLTGKVARATQLLEQVSGGPGRQLQLGGGRMLAVPASAHRARAEFVVGSALGVCDAQMRAAPARLASMVDAMFPSGERPQGAEGAFVERPLLLSLPCLGLDGVRTLREPSHPIARALHGGTTEADAYGRAIAVFESAQRARQSGGGGFDATESALTEAHIYLLRGDTTSAAAALSRSLNGLAVMPNVFLHTEVLAGTLTRVMALRAELARAQGDAALAQRWGAAVAALWANADASLQPTVRKVSSLRTTATEY